MVEYYLPSWEEIHLDLLDISEKILESKIQPNIVVAIARGGWIVGRILSDLLNNKNVGNIRIEFYTNIGETMEKPIISQPISVDPNGKNILLCDDVADTGKSLKAAVEYLKDKTDGKIMVACIHKKPWSMYTPDFYVKETDKWIIYPWEYRETINKIIKNFKKEKLDDNQIRSKIDEIGFPKALIKRILNLKN